MKFYYKVFAVVYIFALFPLQGAPAEEPTFDGTYFRMMFEHGSYYRNPRDKLLASYAEIAKIGCDGTLNSYGNEQMIALLAGFVGMTPEEYFKTTTGLLEENNLAFWPTFGWPKDANPADPADKDKIIASARAFAEKFAALPHFRGLAYDEPHAPDCNSEAFLAAFKAHLLKKYPPDQLQNMGLYALTNPAVNIISPAIVLTVSKNPKLSEAYRRFLQGRIGAQEVIEAAAGERASATEITADAFRQWLATRYSADELRKMGAAAAARSDTKLILPDNDDVKPAGPGSGKPPAQAALDDLLTDIAETKKPAVAPEAKHLVLPVQYDENPVFFMEYEEFVAHQFETLFADIESAVRTVKPGATTLPILSFMHILHAPFRASVARLGRACGAISVDPYWNGAQEEGFWAKLMRSQSRGPSCLTISAGLYGSGPDRFFRDLALCAVHSPAVHIWAWIYAWKERPDYCSAASAHQEGNYDVTVTMFRRIGKVREYLAPSSSTAKIALVYSERDSMWDQAGTVVRPRKGGFVANCHGLHCAFAQLGIQYEPIFEQFITKEELKSFAVLILPGNSYLRPESVRAIEEWVQRGGALIALGDVGKKDRWGRATEESSLKQLLGLASVSATTGTVFQLNAGDDRKLKARYDSVLSAFSYTLATARELGSWSDGATSVAVNSVGKGRVYSVGAERLGICHLGWGGDKRYTVHKDFFPGILEFIDKIVLLAMGDRKGELVLQGLNRPKQTEVTVRSQPGRYVVHLINFVSQDAPVKSGQVTIRVPKGTKPVVFYPEDLSRAEYVLDGQDVKITVRDFDVQEFIVVQYEGPAPKLKESCPGVFILPKTEKTTGRGIACFGKYPAEKTARGMNIAAEEYPLTFLDEPINFKDFSKKHFMISYALGFLNRKHLDNLSDYVRQGGVLHLFENSGLYEDMNGNYLCDYNSGDRWANGALFEELTRARETYTREYYLNRVRFTGKHPFLDNLPSGKWIEMNPKGRNGFYRSHYLSSFFNKASPEDIVVEADLYSYAGKDYAMPGKPYEVKPVVLLHRHGKGWVLWDSTYSMITAKDSRGPEFGILAKNILEWARDASSGSE
ncbi:MAG: beta-galactosidase trimerization domain-containing protein [Kiritimatiellae bacterium]|nr:beta-galactosidase trimerization domain-containing protein [Kiritimatiellia bacterium]